MALNQTNISPTAGIDALTPVFPLLNSGTAVFYSGTQPASTQTALSGNTAIATADFAATALSGSVSSSGGFATGSLAFTSTSLTAAAAGVVTFARLTGSGSSVVADLTAGNNWIASNNVVVGQLQYANGNTYQYTAAGTTASTGSGPSGTGTGITDGTATCQFVFTGPPAVLLANANVAINTTVNITAAAIKIPVN